MKRSSDEPIRVLVVEDSRAQRELLVGMLNASSTFVVVGTASNGKEAIAAAQQLRPNVIAMDIHLPILDGYEATRQIMQQCPTPIVLISSQDDAVLAVGGLAAGALAVVAKPRGRIGSAVAPEQDDDRTAFLTTLRLMANVQVVTRYPVRSPTIDRRPPTTGQLETLVVGHRLPVVVPQVLVIAASTGGPAAVQLVLRGLGAGFPLPVLVVQHIARGFVTALAEWLNTTVPLTVQVAYQGEQLRAGRVYLAPEGHHLTVRTPGFASLRPLATDDRFCPSADLLFETAAQAYGARAIGVVLTGMGDDGTRGLLALRAAGAPTLAQDAASCVVYGMPRAAVEAGAIVRSESLAAIARTILGLVGNVVRDVGAL